MTDVQKKAKVDERPAETIPSRLQWVNVKTNKNKETVAFYEKLLGWAAPETPGGMSDVWAEVKGVKDSTNVSFTPVSHLKFDATVGQLGFCFVVKDLQKFHDFVKDTEGLKVLRGPTKEPWGGFVVTYASPDGSEITFLEDWEYETEPKGCTAAETVESAETNKEDTKKAEAKKETKEEAKTEEKSCAETAEAEGVCYLDLPCSDIKRASKFFIDTFGWKFSQRDGMTCFESGEKNLSGMLTEREDRLQGGMLYINANNMDETVTKVKANGGSVVKDWSALPPTPAVNHFIATIKDTEGNEWGLYHWEYKNKRKSSE